MNPLRAFLESRGETASAFAARVQMSPSFLSRLMSGEREADATTLFAIWDATGGEVTADAWVRWWSQREASGAGDRAA